MNNNSPKIGLAFSGGGFRASSFNLGVLSLLNEIKVDDSTLLEKVYALSSISGGTITAARYTQGIEQGESFKEIYQALYQFMAQTDIVEFSLSNLLSKRPKSDQRSRSLILAFADVYDQYLFAHGKFGSILEQKPSIHLKHISFNATEFDHALQFRFQKTENENKEQSEQGKIGNYYFGIPEEVAKEIRLADILAASSCFPGGFEPINFPDDFGLNNFAGQIKCNKNSRLPIGLMDGGIVDNQGIDPLLLANKRMQTKAQKDSDTNAFDLLIISDVASPFMEGYKPQPEEKSSILNLLSFKGLMLFVFIILVVASWGLYHAFQISSMALAIGTTALISFSLLVYFLLFMIKKLPSKFDVPHAFLKPFQKLLKVRFNVYRNMILNRSNSVLKLSGEVFLKHIRRLNYNQVYKDKSWKNRRIMNAIYELSWKDNELHLVNGEMKPINNRDPLRKIKDVASLASSMGTTLWFTKEELEKKDMLNSIIACGQFTMCWNLLEYIDKLKKDSENTNENHKLFSEIEDQLKELWEKFQHQPKYLVERYRLGIE